MARFGERFWARVAVEGWPDVFVTHASMVQTLADDREQIGGLDISDVSLKVNCSLQNATIESEGFTVRLADKLGKITESLGKVPSVFASLVSDLSAAATTATVDSTADFPSSGVVHIGTEAIKYSGKTATTFTGLTRGAWGTIAQKHVVPGGEGRLYPLVTTIPQGLRGRRVYLYVYTNKAAADSAGNPDPSDSDITWRGIAGTDRRYSEARWTFQVSPITSLFDQEIGGDLDGSVPIRGVYYPSTAPFVLTMARLTGASNTSGWSSTDRFDEYFDTASASTRRGIGIIGFYETQGEFLDDLQAELDNRTAAWDSGGWPANGESLTVQETAGGFRFVYRTGSADVRYIALTNRFPISEMDRIAAETAGVGLWADEDGNSVDALAADTHYYLDVVSPYPRSTYGYANDRTNEARLFVDPAVGIIQAPADRIYLGGSIVPTTSMVVELEADGEIPPSQRMTRVARTVDTSDRWITVRPARSREIGLVVFGAGTRFKFARLMGSGTVEDFRSALVTNAPDLHTTGGSPLISADDVPSWETEVDLAIGGMRLGTGRQFITREGMTVADILAEEWKLIGVHPTLDSQGRVVVKRLGLASATSAITATITAADTVGDFPTLERNGYSTLGTVLYRTGYDSNEDDHLGRTFKARSLRALSINPQAGVLEVAPLSESEVVDASGLEIDPRDAVEASSRVLGIFGAPYDVVTLALKWSFNTLRPGDAVSISSSLLPGSDGLMGVTSNPGLVESVQADLSTGIVSVRCLVTLQRIGGYAPSYRVASNALVAGTTYDLTLTYADYGDDAPGDVLEASDAIIVSQRNTRTPTTQTGTVDSVTSGSAVVRVTLAGAIPSSDLSLEYDVAANVQTSQEIYTFIGDSSRRVAFTSGTQRAKDFSP